MKLATLLAVEAHAEGRAQRAALVRHRRLHKNPMTICAFQLGAEPFSAAAIAWGTTQRGMKHSVAGDPRNRDLLFAMLEGFAREFNAYFEKFYDDYEIVTRRNGREDRIATRIPQIVVPSRDTALLLGRLGRRLAYLSTEGERPASPELVRLGRHLMWCREHAALYGQQLLVSLTDLIDEHWVCTLNQWEAQSLAALDAFIDPPAGVHGHTAASVADRVPLGPRPDAALDRRLEPLLETFDKKRDRSTDPKLIASLLAPIDRHYKPLLERAWRLTWTGLVRERGYEEARFVEDRYADDREAYSRHMDWVERAGGIRRTRHTMRQAIARVRDLEDTRNRVTAQEYCDDPLKMVDLLAAGEAIIGTVLHVDEQHRIQGPKQMVKRPLITIRVSEPCPLLPGDTVHWDQAPDKDFEIIAIDRGPGGADEITLLLHNPGLRSLPAVGEEACFSLYGTGGYWNAYPPKDVPWTHQSLESAQSSGSIEDDQEAVA
jgi:hypothetical protein